MSSVSFNFYMSEIDTEMSKRGIGEIKLEQERIWTLVYADDMVLLTKSRVTMQDMIRTLKRFLENKRLLLNE